MILPNQGWRIFEIVSISFLWMSFKISLLPHRNLGKVMGYCWLIDRWRLGVDLRIPPTWVCVYEIVGGWSLFRGVSKVFDAQKFMAFERRGYNLHKWLVITLSLFKSSCLNWHINFRMLWNCCDILLYP